MKLKELLLTIKYGTNVCVCDEMGPWNDTCPIEKLPMINVIDGLDRKVEQIYIDTSDMSITIELVNNSEED